MFSADLCRASHAKRSFWCHLKIISFIAVWLASIGDYWCLAKTIAPQSEHGSIKRMEPMKVFVELVWMWKLIRHQYLTQEILTLSQNIMYGAKNYWWLSLLYVHYCCPIWAWIHLISHNEWKLWWIGLDVKINLASILYLPVRDYHSIFSKQVQSIIFIVVSTENILLKTTRTQWHRR